MSTPAADGRSAAAPPQGHQSGHADRLPDHAQGGRGRHQRGRRDPKTRFRTKAVFEIDQTDESEDFTPDPEAASEDDPARIWHDRLRREASNLGYTVAYTRPDEAEAPAVTDRMSKTIAVAAADPLALTPEALGALADRLAEAMTAAKADGSAKPTTTAGRRAEPDEGTVLEFE